MRIARCLLWSRGIAGTEYSHHRAGHWRRIWKQGTDLSWLCLRRGGFTHLGVPVKWIETRSENLQSTGFARDYHMKAEIAADQDGKVKAMRVKTLADHGAFNAAAQPTKFPAGLVQHLHRFV